MTDYTKRRFECLFKDCYPHMYRMAFSMVGDADDAKDAVHQVFAQMWKGKPEVGDAQVGGYLLAATRNQCLHILRRRELRRRMEGELQRDAEEGLRAGASAGMGSSDEREELMRELRQAIDDSLTEQDRRVLELHYDEALTYRETATVLGMAREQRHRLEPREGPRHAGG